MKLMYSATEIYLNPVLNNHSYLPRPSSDSTACSASMISVLLIISSGQLWRHVSDSLTGGRGGTFDVFAYGGV